MLLPPRLMTFSVNGCVKTDTIAEIICHANIPL